MSGNQHTPRGQFIFYEDDKVFNYGKYLKATQDASVAFQALYGNATIFSNRFTMAGAGVYWIRVTHSGTSKLYVYNKKFTISQGLFYVDTIAGTAPVTETGTTTGVAKSALNNGNPTVSSVLYTNAAAPTSTTVKEYHTLSASDQASQSGSSFENEDLIKIYSTDFWLRVEKVDTGSATVNFSLICAEV